MIFSNIISESKSFLLLLLFMFTLTTQSFASSIAEADENKCAKTENLTTLSEEEKKICRIWCAKNLTAANKKNVSR